MLPLLIAVPLGFAALSFVIGSAAVRRWLVPLLGFVQLGLVAVAVSQASPPAWNGWLALDALGRICLVFTAVLYLPLSLYTGAYLRQRAPKNERLFCAAMLASPGILAEVMLAQHMGLLWVGLEACTLTAAPLVFQHGTARSVEATWKFLIVGSVGIAVALLGCFFLGYAVLHAGHAPSLLFSDLKASAPLMSRSWLRAAIIFLLVGYGTKLGLAPMHTWKPDAYGEAPGVVGALLAGGVTTAAFLAILRVYQVALAAGEASFMRKPMIALGLVSMLVAAVFMAQQKDYKRMLAYSSIEHMGLLVIGIGIGGGAIVGSLYHLVNNGLVKGVLFLSAGNIHRAFGSKSTEDVRGAMRRTPWSAACLLIGFLAVTGSPPFPIFQSEFMIVRAAVAAKAFWLVVAVLVLLLVIFVGMGATVLSVVQGEPSAGRDRPSGPLAERMMTVLPPCLLVALLMVLGSSMPRFVLDALRAGALLLGAP